MQGVAFVSGAPFFLVAYLLATALHEAGHALLGLAGRYQIFAVGLGFGRPLLVVPCGSARLYLAWPLWGGLTLAYRDRLTTPLLGRLAFLAGGIAANVATAAAAAVALHLGAQSRLLEWLTFAAALQAATNALPLRFARGGISLQSDGAQIRDLFAQRSPSLSPALALARLIRQREFLRALDSRRGDTFYTLLIAAAQLSLDDVDGARETLEEPAAVAAKREPSLVRLDTLVRALVSLGGDESSESLDAAAGSLSDDPLARASLALAQATHALDHAQQHAGMLVDEALRAARATNTPSLLANAEALALENAPPANLREAVRPFLAKFDRGQMSGASALRLVSFATLRATQTGDWATARALFPRAQQLVRHWAEGVMPPSRRNALLAKHGRALRAAVLAVPESEPPLFLAPDPTVAMRPAPSRFRPIVLVLVPPICLFAFFVWAGARLESDASATSTEQRKQHDVWAAGVLRNDVRTLRALRSGDVDSNVAYYEKELDRTRSEYRRKQDPGRPPELASALSQADEYRRDFPKPAASSAAASSQPVESH